MDVSRIGGGDPFAASSIRPAAQSLVGNNAALQRNKTPFTGGVKVDISDEARKILMGHDELGKNSQTDAILESGLDESDLNPDGSAQKLSSSDSVDEYLAKAANDKCQRDLSEMVSRSDKSMFLIRALGITTGRVDISEKGISQMMELYNQKLMSGELPFFARGPIEDNFPGLAEAAPAETVQVGELSFREMMKAGRMAAIDAAVGEKKADLEMRMYWGDYIDIFTGGSPSGWRNFNMETMYSQASEIYKQIEESDDSEETKALKRQGLENALQTGTSMYAMNKVTQKMYNDAQEAEAQGRQIDRSFASKAKFDELSKVSKVLRNITSMFFNNLKTGTDEGADYTTMIADAVGKMMSYRHPS